MTNERARANDTPQPVTRWQNEEVKGHALCYEDLFTEHVEKTKALRERQATYLASLPTDPPEAIRAALKVLHPDGDCYPEGIEEAMNLTYALEAMMKDGDLDACGGSRDAALFLADRVTSALHRATRQMDRIADILGNSNRIELGGS